MTVRWATPDDKNDVFKIALHAHSEIGIFPFSVEKFQALWATYTDQMGGACGVIGEPGQLQGAVFLGVSTTFYSDELYLSDRFLFVYPAYRKSTNARDLVEFSKYIAREMEMKLLMGITTLEKTRQKVEFYERQLGAPVGAVFLWRP